MHGRKFSNQSETSFHASGAASLGDFYPTFQDNAVVSSSKVDMSMKAHMV